MDDTEDFEDQIDDIVTEDEIEKVANDTVNSQPNSSFFNIVFDPTTKTISCNGVANFDSDSFLSSIRSQLSALKDPKDKHTFKLFICKAFKIPMDQMTDLTADTEFVESISEATKGFDLDSLEPATGSIKEG